ncbi:MAG: peptidyl-prolyl cis-trans isomerase [Holophagales bacterium]|jgi:cyclophilin family peptidyl-prolyl cis-trans isomerase|nr:peptidyl-prolyl cis-trans isomerase [Holophagales bacterium]
MKYFGMIVRPFLNAGIIIGLSAALFCQEPQAESQVAPQVKPRVALNTSYGTVVLELEPSIAPQTVENFLNYVKSGYYDGTIFHRVIAGFMIQGGGFTEKMEEKQAGSPIRNESKADSLKNVRGTIAMARLNDPHSATTQFFINLVDNQVLDSSSGAAARMGYCVFGRVVSGMEYVDKIAKVKTIRRMGHTDVPEFPVRLLKATLMPVEGDDVK